MGIGGGDAGDHERAQHRAAARFVDSRLHAGTTPGRYIIRSVPDNVPGSKAKAGPWPTMRWLLILIIVWLGAGLFLAEPLQA